MVIAMTKLESIILNKALDIGANMIDTADAYEKC